MKMEAAAAAEHKVEMAETHLFHMDQQLLLLPAVPVVQAVGAEEEEKALSLAQHQVQEETEGMVEIQAEVVEAQELEVAKGEVAEVEGMADQVQLVNQGLLHSPDCHKVHL